MAGRDRQARTASTWASPLGPRLNAAGRLADMALGIECLITDDTARALNIAQELDRLNRERREIEADMQEQALAMLDGARARRRMPASLTLSLYDPAWHQGVVGIFAARLKDRLHRPTFVFARGNDGRAQGLGPLDPGPASARCAGSGRQAAPGLILRFGGHAAAAGLTLARRPGAVRRTVREHGARPACARRSGAQHRDRRPAGIGLMNLDTIRLLQREVWGQGFPQPLFCDRFTVASQRVVGEKHLKLRLQKDGKSFDAIRFNSLAPAGSAIRAAYRLAVNEYNGVQSVQFIVEEWESAA